MQRRTDDNRLLCQMPGRKGSENCSELEIPPDSALKFPPIVTNEDGPSHGEDWRDGAEQGSFLGTRPVCGAEHAKRPWSAQTAIVVTAP